MRLLTLVLVLIAAIAAAATAHAQQAQRVYKVGIVWNSLPQADLDKGVTEHPGPRIIEEGLRSFGWVRGRNVELISRSAESRRERFAPIVDEFLRIPVDVLVFFGNDGAQIAIERTKTIPIVIVDGYFERLVASLSRPGGNVTGNAAVVVSPWAKRLEILKTIAPKTARVALLGPVRPDGTDPEITPGLAQDAKRLGVEPFVITFRSDDQLPEVIAEAKRQGANAMVVAVWPRLTWGDVPVKLLRLVAEHKIPTIYPIPNLAQSGGLVAYGPDQFVGYRRAPYFIDRILRGTKAGDLPIEQPASVHLSINRRTARQLGLEIPSSLLVLADNVYE